MLNFNSREVAERFREQCVADGLWPMQGDSEIEHRLAAFLDSALLAAHPEVEDLIDSITDYELEGSLATWCYAKFRKSREDAISLFAAALETAKREAEKQTIEDILAYCHEAGHQEVMKSLDEYSEKTYSLAEKEGHDAH